MSSSYPTSQWVFNISRATTKKEIIEIEGIKEQTKRIQALNLSGGRINAVEFCTQMFGLPNLKDLGKIFDNQK